MASPDELAAAEGFQSFMTAETGFAQAPKRKSLAKVKSRLKDVNALKFMLHDVDYYLRHGTRNTAPPSFDPGKPLFEMHRGEMLHLQRWAGREDKFRKEKAEKLARVKKRRERDAASVASQRSNSSNPYSDNASISSVDSKSQASWHKSPKGPGRTLVGDDGGDLGTRSTRGSVKGRQRSSAGQDDSTARSGSQALRSGMSPSVLTYEPLQRCPNTNCFCRKFWGDDDEEF